MKNPIEFLTAQLKNFNDQLTRIFRLHFLSKELKAHMARDPNFVTDALFDSESKVAIAEASLRDAHQAGRYILQVSKNAEGVSQIQPEIKFDQSTKKFYLEISEDQDLKLAAFITNAPRIPNGGLSRKIASAVVPLTADTFYPMLKVFFAEVFSQYQEDYPYHSPSDIEKCEIDGIVREKLNLPTSDGVPLSGIEVYTKKNADTKAYIVHFHSNACSYEHLIDQLENLAKKTNCKVIAFDYRGFGLSLGEIIDQTDLYRDAFAYAKHCVDQGATYILLDGISLGGTVAAKTANLLRAYCKEHQENVQIEHFNSLSFSSTHDFVMGKIKEVNVPSGKQSQHGWFRTILAGIIAPLNYLVLAITNWAQKPKAEIEAMPADSYEVINAKGDIVIGTYASMEYQLRHQCQKEIAACKEQIATHQQIISQIRERIIAEFNTRSDVKFKPYALDQYTADEVRTIAKKLAIFDSVQNDINLLREQEFLLKKVTLALNMKENRLMWTSRTSDYKDSEGDPYTDTHDGGISHLSNNVVSAVDKQETFINTRDVRNPGVPYRESIASLNQALRMFPHPVVPKQKCSTNLPIKIDTFEHLLAETARLAKIYTHRPLIATALQNMQQFITTKKYTNAYEYLQQLPDFNISIAHYREAALSYLKLQQLSIEQLPIKQVRFAAM